MNKLTIIKTIFKVLIYLAELFKKDKSAGQEKNDLRDLKQSDHYKENVHNETKTLN